MSVRAKTPMKITYSTMSADNEELQAAFDEALAKVRAERLGVEVPMLIDGERRWAEEKMLSFSPTDTRLLLCTAQKGTRTHAQEACDAARAAAASWAATPWQERVAAIRRAEAYIHEHNFELASLMVLEVGKSRVEALGEVEETADFMRVYAEEMERNNGFMFEAGKVAEGEHNFSVLKPYGVWAVISPFNFPFALSLAPAAAAIITGNTVVFKGASSTLYNGWLTAEIFEAAGLPPGVFNYVSGPGRSVGQELLDNPQIDGWTFTGSYDVGMQVARTAAAGRYPRPAIVEMGGKNPAIISDRANVDLATTGVMRSAFGLDGQKCSACSRAYVHEAVYDDFVKQLVEKTSKLVVGNPADRNAFMGTVIDKSAYEDFQRFAAIARRDGQVLFGGDVIKDGDFRHGYYVQPTIFTGVGEEHELVANELFLPILFVTRVPSVEEAMRRANATFYGLTAGIFSDDEREQKWFLDNIQAGTIYVNRAAGATTGAWPGAQAFGGWKGSGSSGKGTGGRYTLPLYMHEQSQTLIY